MNISQTLKKAFLALTTFVTAYFASESNISNLVSQIVPENIAQLTVGGLVASLIVGATNWFKNKTK